MFFTIEMLPIGSLKGNAYFLLWCICCVRTSVSLKEVFAEEGKEWSLNCIGNKTRHLKNIWWTSNNTILSKCHPGNQRCINYNPQEYTAVQSETYQKYTSRLTIHPVGPGHRDKLFHCGDDGGDYNDRQSFLLRVYHVPHTPVCAAEELPRGRIKVVCETPKVYPSVTCEISQQYCSVVDNPDCGNGSSTTVQTDAILYKSLPFKDGTTDYYSGSCSVTITVSQTGLYRFKVKMFPGITNTLVASVDGYTNNVTIQFPLDNDGSNKKVQKAITEQSVAIRENGKHRAEALTDYQNSGNKKEDTITSDVDIKSNQSMCEDSKDEIIKRQLIVIMLLTILVACIFFMNIFSKINNPLCKRSKIKDPTRV